MSKRRIFGGAYYPNFTVFVLRKRNTESIVLLAVKININLCLFCVFVCSLWQKRRGSGRTALGRRKNAPWEKHSYVRGPGIKKLVPSLSLKNLQSGRVILGLL